MKYNANSINVSLLKSFNREIKNDKKKFETFTYNAFLSSYLYNSNNKLIKKYTRNIDKMYLKINSDYEKIIDYLTSYNENVDALEKSLINGVGVSNLESNIKNYVDSNINETK